MVITQREYNVHGEAHASRPSFNSQFQVKGNLIVHFNLKTIEQPWKLTFLNRFFAKTILKFDPLFLALIFHATLRKLSLIISPFMSLYIYSCINTETNLETNPVPVTVQVHTKRHILTFISFLINNLW